MTTVVEGLGNSCYDTLIWACPGGPFSRRGALSLPPSLAIYQAQAALYLERRAGCWGKACWTPGWLSCSALPGTGQA